MAEKILRALFALPPADAESSSAMLSKSCDCRQTATEARLSAYLSREDGNDRVHEELCY